VGVCEVESLFPFRVLRPTRVDPRVSPRMAPFPSCSSRVLQSVSRQRSIAVSVDDPSLALALSNLTFEVFLRHPGGKKPQKLLSASSRGLRSAPGYSPNRTASREAHSHGVSRPYSA